MAGLTSRSHDAGFFVILPAYYTTSEIALFSSVEYISAWAAPMSTQEHADLFQKRGADATLQYLWDRLQARDLSQDEALALVSAVHRELGQSKAAQPNVYATYSRFMEALNEGMPLVHDYVVARWNESRYAVRKQARMEPYDPVDGDERAGTTQIASQAAPGLDPVVRSGETEAAEVGGEGGGGEEGEEEGDEEGKEQEAEKPAPEPNEGGDLDGEEDPTPDEEEPETEGNRDSKIDDGEVNEAAEQEEAGAAEGPEVEAEDQPTEGAAEEPEETAEDEPHADGEPAESGVEKPEASEREADQGEGGGAEDEKEWPQEEGPEPSESENQADGEGEEIAGAE